MPAGKRNHLKNDVFSQYTQVQNFYIDTVKRLNGSCLMPGWSFKQQSSCCEIENEKENDIEMMVHSTSNEALIDVSKGGTNYLRDANNFRIGRLTCKFTKIANYICWNRVKQACCRSTIQITEATNEVFCTC